MNGKDAFARTLIKTFFYKCQHSHSDPQDKDIDKSLKQIFSSEVKTFCWKGMHVHIVVCNGLRPFGVVERSALGGIAPRFPSSCGYCKDNKIAGDGGTTLTLILTVIPPRRGVISHLKRPQSVKCNDTFWLRQKLEHFVPAPKLSKHNTNLLVSDSDHEV